TGLQRTAPADTGAPSASGSSAGFDQLVTNLSPETVYRWRVRFETDSPFFPRSPWLSLPYNGRTETDFRTEGCSDADADGYGSPGQPFCPNGSQTDCNDSNPAIHPGATELCNNVDDDCDGTVDSFTSSCGLGACASQGTCPAGHDSCAPGSPSPETCDNIDNDCDGTVDGFATSCGIGGCTRQGTCTAGSDSCVPGSP